MARRNALQEALDPTIHDQRRLQNELRICELVAAAVQEMASQHKMTTGEMLSATVGTLTSLVQARVPVEEWAETGLYIGESIQRRLTVKQD